MPGVRDICEYTMLSHPFYYGSRWNEGRKRTRTEEKETSN